MATATKEITVEDKLQSLYELQQIHSKLDEIQVLKGELPMEVSDLEDEIAGLETRLHNLEEESKEFDKTIANNKIKAKEAQELIKKYEKQQANVKNNREYDALSKEIELQNLEIQLLEKRNKEAKESIDSKKDALEDAKNLLSDKNKELEIKKKELDKIIADTDKEEKKLEKEAEKQAKKIEERLLVAFNRTRHAYRNGLAVVPVQRDACGGCFALIPPQRQLEIRQRKKVIVCEHCGRILIDAEMAGLEG